MIRVGGRKVKVTIQETSIDGFTVLVPPKYASRLKVGRKWVLEYDGTRQEVHPQWFFNSPDGHVQMGLRRIADLTKPDPIRSSWLVWLGGARCDNPSSAAVVFGGIVLGLFAVMASPGLGDQLGTADRIENAVNWVAEGVNDAFESWI